MSDPQQQPPVPPYASNAGQPPQHPQPPYQQPPYQAQPPQGYVLNSQPAQPGRAISASVNSNTPGKVGLILGAASIALQLILNAVLQLAVHDFDVFTVVNSTFTTLIFLTALGALIFGIIGIRRVGAPQTLAGIATGIGITIAVSTAFYFILSTLRPLLSF